MLVAGGTNSTGNPLNSAEIYNPTTGRWNPLSNTLITAHYNQTATLLLNGKVLLVGGQSGASVPLNNSELFDAGLGFNNVWQPKLTTVPTWSN